ncbi:hypothetical protein BpOF4_21639 (plasmid) [Alkalihalophilus pseudofirmus OF4]|uniref:Uncharacterized protein n=2 Tax=Alkalihalophilus TaxID=2893060 RepID=D3G1U7_ALKPO|nr:hypothetical protein BpOF4_21639 [Alkalihalophilus pseudofirmus OF4]ERN51515.1 hypothetical protein A33I_20305 [Alkalihalophilus marmarensis DSM 21297]
MKMNLIFIGLMIVVLTISIIGVYITTSTPSIEDFKEHLVSWYK